MKRDFRIVDSTTIPLCFETYKGATSLSVGICLSRRRLSGNRADDTGSCYNGDKRIFLTQREKSLLLERAEGKMNYSEFLARAGEIAKNV